MRYNLLLILTILWCVNINLSSAMESEHNISLEEQLGHGAMTEGSPTVLAEIADRIQPIPVYSEIVSGENKIISEKLNKAELDLAYWESRRNPWAFSPDYYPNIMIKNLQLEIEAYKQAMKGTVRK